MAPLFAVATMPLAPPSLKKPTMQDASGKPAYVL
jgi:hypothetical protein